MICSIVDRQEANFIINEWRKSVDSGRALNINQISKDSIILNKSLFYKKYKFDPRMKKVLKNSNALYIARDWVIVLNMINCY